MAQQFDPGIEFKKIAKELYKKNLELVNANTELAMIQRLYEIMAQEVKVKNVAQKFINVIVKDLNFQLGAVLLKNKSNTSLKTIAISSVRRSNATQVQFANLLKSTKIATRQRKNTLVQVYSTKKKSTTNSQDKVFAPILSTDKRQLCKDPKIRSVLVYPLHVGDKKIGVFLVTSHRQLSELTSQEKKNMNRVAIVFGIAIDRVMIYQDLLEANRQLKILDALKDEFVSIASHELRTPMTAIKSYIWLILHKPQKEDQLSEKTDEYLRRAFISTERLINLVNDMLDVSRIEAGRIEINLESLDMIKLCHEVENEVLAKLSERNLKLEINQDTSIPLIKADPDKIHQVLINLIGNGIKFTPPGGIITISFKVNPNSIITSVTDTGKGIAKQDIPKLFSKFGRLEHSLVSMAEAGGTGLGLYISQQLIKLHGGDIWVESELNKGSTFSFKLPRT